MSKIYGDEFKKEIRELKALDRKILKCKAKAEEIRYECENNIAFNKVSITIQEAIRSLLSLSKKVIMLRDILSEYDKSLENLPRWITKELYSNQQDVDNFKRIESLREGANKLTKSYSDTLKIFGKRLRDQNNER